MILEKIEEIFKPKLDDEYYKYIETSSIKKIKDNIYEINWIIFYKDSFANPYHMSGKRLDISDIITNVKRVVTIDNILDNNNINNINNINFILEDLLSDNPKTTIEDIREQNGLDQGFEKIYRLNREYYINKKK